MGSEMCIRDRGLGMLSRPRPQAPLSQSYDEFKLFKGRWVIAYAVNKLYKDPLTFLGVRMTPVQQMSFREARPLAFNWHLRRAEGPRGIV